MAAIHHFTFLMMIFTDVVYAELKTVDLTHNFDEHTVYWPTAQKYKYKFEDAGSNLEFGYRAYRFCTAEHGGTHMDAPNHFFTKGVSHHAAHEVPLDRLIGGAFIVDVSKESGANRDLLITTNHLLNAERSQRMTMDNKIVLLYTGFSKRWPDLNTYLGTNTTNVKELHFPGLHPDAAKWIITNRKIKAIGIDTASIDQARSDTFSSHVFLFKLNIPVFENVNLKDIDEFRAKDNVMIYALPMKIKGGSGGPLRIIATYGNAACTVGVHSTILSFCLIIVAYFVSEWTL